MNIDITVEIARARANARAALRADDIATYRRCALVATALEAMRDERNEAFQKETTI